MKTPPWWPVTQGQWFFEGPPSATSRETPSRVGGPHGPDSLLPKKEFDHRFTCFFPLRHSSLAPLLPQSPLLMAKTTKGPPCHALTPAESLAHTFLNSRLQIGQLKEQAELLLTSKNFQRVVEQLTPEDLERLVRKFHEVRHSGCRSCFPIVFFISYCVHKGVSYRRRPRQKVFDLVRRLLQCYKAIPTFSRALRWACEVWQHSQSFRRVDGRMARKTQGHPGGYQSLSRLLSSKFGRGEEGAYSIYTQRVSLFQLVL